MTDMIFEEIDEGHETERAKLACELGFLTEKQLSVLARIKVSTLGEWRKRGNGPAYSRFGNAFFYPKTSVKDFMESKQTEFSKDWIRV